MISIDGIELPYHTVRRKICVDKQEFLEKLHKTIEKKLEIENGPIEGKGTGLQNFNKTKEKYNEKFANFILIFEKT